MDGISNVEVYKNSDGGLLEVIMTTHSSSDSLGLFTDLIENGENENDVQLDEFKVL